MRRIAVRLLGVALSALVLLLVVATLRALRLPSRQLRVPPAPARTVDAAPAAQHLAAAIRIPTISYSNDPAQLQGDAFDAFARWLAETYPRLHASLALERVSEHSLVYTWRGTEPALQPILLLAHQDVVPAENAERWAHPPFDGAIADGFVWGRGAIDDKGPLVAICEAVELLLGEGVVPRRTVILAFGHDEEVGGPRGAQVIAATLAARGVRAALVLDEGYAIVTGGVLSGIDLLLAPVGIAEKGSATLELVARAEGGHSSTPPRHTAAGILARAVARLEDRPMPASIGGVTGRFLAFLAPELPFWARLPLANIDLALPLVDALLGEQPAINALLRTTTAVTMLSGSPKENVLPVEAIAGVNFRILPGDTSEQVRERVEAAIGDPRVEVRFKVPPREASQVSPIEGPAFALLQRTIGELFPEAVVAPALVIGGTDARYYHPVAEHVYRFGPFRFGADDLKRPHGVDERLAVDGLADAIRFYARLIENASALDAP